MKKLGIVLLLAITLQINAQGLEGTYKGKCKFISFKQTSTFTLYLKNQRYMNYVYDGFGVEKIGKYTTTFKFHFLFDPGSPMGKIYRDDIFDVITKDYRGRNIEYDPEIVHCVCAHDLLLCFDFEKNMYDIGMVCEEAIIFWDVRKKFDFVFFVNN